MKPLKIPPFFFFSVLAVAPSDTVGDPGLPMTLNAPKNEESSLTMAKRHFSVQFSVLKGKKVSAIFLPSTSVVYGMELSGERCMTARKTAAKETILLSASSLLKLPTELHWPRRQQLQKELAGPTKGSCSPKTCAVRCRTPLETSFQTSTQLKHDLGQKHKTMKAIKYSPKSAA